MIKFKFESIYKIKMTIKNMKNGKAMVNAEEIFYFNFKTEN